MFDLALLGSGFGGSILAMIARRLGLRVILLERGRHPRFAIGESASPLAGVLIEQLADRYDLPRLRPLASYGAWQRQYPEIGCGLKRGFTYFKHEEGRRFRSRPDRANQLLVAASPGDEVSDTHWLRADVDHFLVQEAVAIGCEYADLVALETLAVGDEGVRLAGVRDGRAFQVGARLVIDATGPGGFVGRALGIAAPGFPRYPATQALYSHFTGVARCADLSDYAGPDTPPFPPDAAALHHVFDGGWMWVLRFDSGVTSAGVAVTDALAGDLRLADGARAWHRFLARFPTVAAQFAEAEPVREFTWMPRLAYRTAAAAGDRWAMLPSAAAFIDPLFSTGIPMTLLGIERLAAALADWSARGDGGAGRLPPWSDYSATTLAEADHTARFVRGCYAAFPRFPEFTAYSMCYFAAASFSEMTRRVGRTPPGFLCAADAAFAEAVAQLSPAEGRRPPHPGASAAATDRLNVAGLCDPGKRNWYGVDVDDAVRHSAKLGVDADVVRRAVREMSVV
jgi:FADH2 O2-dependent halogenase